MADQVGEKGNGIARGSCAWDMVRVKMATVIAVSEAENRKDLHISMGQRAWCQGGIRQSVRPRAHTVAKPEQSLESVEQVHNADSP